FRPGHARVRTNTRPTQEHFSGNRQGTCLHAPRSTCLHHLARHPSLFRHLDLETLFLVRRDLCVQGQRIGLSSGPLSSATINRE
ncbi:hypothetical protein BGZ52_011131, partial [Haplosporangium bisporale]